MSDEKQFKLLTRQLKDIQAQADQILNGDNSLENIETFSRYSEELKQYIYKHIDSSRVRAHLAEIPDINYEPLQFRVWQYMILPIMPFWWWSLYKDHEAKNQAVVEIGQARGKYASLELLMRELS